MSGRSLSGLVRAAALLALCAVAAQLPAANPATKAECLQMTRAPLEGQCRSIFAGAGRESERQACLEAIGPQLEAVCEQFFGAGRDFCATCTTGCTQAYASGDTKRRECLSMCLQQPGCQ
jgi:hypothetical protein